MIQERKTRGFTLIEVLIVVVALAVLAGIAVPLVRAAVEKARKAEALAHLSSLRQSEMRYFAEKNTFTTSLGLLDYDPGAATGVTQNPHFTYTISAAASTTFSAVATRNTADSPPAAFSAKTVTINQAGTIGGTYP